MFQSPYGDFGTLTLSLSTRSLTGLTGDFSNLGLFSPFRGTRVKNKNLAVSFIRFVTPFVAILEIFKPTGFLTLK